MKGRREYVGDGRERKKEKEEDQGVSGEGWERFG